jgi:hypothetical protein
LKFEDGKIMCCDASDSSAHTSEYEIEVKDKIKKMIIESEMFQKLFDDTDYDVRVADKLLIFKSEALKLVYIIISIKVQ